MSDTPVPRIVREKLREGYADELRAELRALERETEQGALTRGLLNEIERLRAREAELVACLGMAMDEWANWMDESRGQAPEDDDLRWRRCQEALAKGEGHG